MSFLKISIIKDIIEYTSPLRQRLERHQKPENMLTEKTMERLRILAESAKYDVSCSSSGTVRSGRKGMVGNTVGGVGICHSFADDGRCISLLKVMLTNH